jgi:ketosteroid isomerase-like protein
MEYFSTRFREQMMTKRFKGFFACFIFVGIASYLIAEQAKTDPKKVQADLKKELMDADRAFAKATKEKGLDGWMSFMAEDAVRILPLGGKAHIGTEAVKELDKKLFADPNKRQLLWEPTDGGAFSDGNHGFTTGTSKMIVKTENGKEEVLWTGAYVTCWRKDQKGQWKVILDTGVADPVKK